DESPKTYTDFLRLFNQAKNLPDTSVLFNSARLFQTGQWKQPTVPSEAFKAAIDTNTTLLLGIWISSISTELVALDNAFKTHGQKLADLVIGISVGNEDIYRSSLECRKHNNNQPCPSQATAEQVNGHVTAVREAMKPWNNLFKTPPPIGHTDIVQFAAQDDLDFMGTNIYPYWANDPIDKAKESMGKKFDEVARHASSKPVWITETGWPSSGKEEGTMFAGSVQDMRRYWVEVGCKYFGKHNIWWFQLEQDTKDVFDWGILDVNTKQPKFDLSCP
ncbi:glycoside hydrolase family 17 protein, partial [Periconia macrospinosa]